MLDKQDITLLRGMFRENNEDLKRDIRDEIHSSILASEHRMITRMDAMEDRILSNFNSFMDISVLPQIAELQVDMLVVKKKLKVA